mmetsp:Transcript_92172/g.199294  ORF Transcript_92172/g.199294 Transcript_92172/m.199294 type:complete len:278 (-) Transcript_92172:328-1161(-)
MSAAASSAPGPCPSWRPSSTTSGRSPRPTARSTSSPWPRPSPGPAPRAPRRPGGSWRAHSSPAGPRSACRSSARPCSPCRRPSPPARGRSGRPWPSSARRTIRSCCHWARTAWHASSTPGGSTAANCLPPCGRCCTTRWSTTSWRSTREGSPGPLRSSRTAAPTWSWPSRSGGASGSRGCWSTGGSPAGGGAPRPCARRGSGATGSGATAPSTPGWPAACCRASSRALRRWRTRRRCSSAWSSAGPQSRAARRPPCLRPSSRSRCGVACAARRAGCP